MANEILNFTNSLLSSVNAVNGVWSDYTQKQAELSTNVKQSRLQSAINSELARIKQDTHYENWNDEINTFFENVKNGMSNKDSPYYCQNNLQAQMFSKILDQNLINVSDHVNNMVINEQQSQARVDINNGILNYKNQGYAGQDLYDLSKKLVDGGWAIKAYTREQYNQMLDQIFYDSYGSMYEQMFDKTWSEAIDRGDSWDTVKSMMLETAPQMMKTDGDNMPVAFDKEAYDSRIFDNLERKFKAKQQDIWNQTEKKCSQLFDNVMDGTTYEERNQARLVGRQYLDTLKNTGRISPEQLTKWTNYFKLEDPKTTQTGAESALKKLTPKDRMEYFIHAWQRGDESEMGGAKNLYNAYDAFKKITLEEMQQARGNYGLTWNDIEKECPTYMEFLDYAKKNLPPSFSNVIKNAENVVSSIVNTKEDKNLYKAEMDKLSDWLYDLLFETNVSDLDGPELEKLNKRVATAINSIYGGVLEKQKDYEWLKKEPGMEAVTGYKEGVIGNEKRLAQAIQARDKNPDLWYKDMYGTNKRLYGNDIESGLTWVEAAEKKEIAKYLKYNEGIDIDTDTIGGQLDEEGSHDIQARKVYTVGNKQYRFRSDDGKNVIMEEKGLGKDAGDWKQVRTAKAQEKYDSPRETAKRAVQDIDVSTVPPFEVPGSGMIPKVKYSQKQWDDMNNVQKKNVIMSLLKKYPEEMQEWLDQQPDKAKK
jgi:hypothetical protein